VVESALQPTIAEETKADPNASRDKMAILFIDYSLCYITDKA